MSSYTTRAHGIIVKYTTVTYFHILTIGDIYDVISRLNCIKSYNKKKITRWLEDMNFIFSWWKQYFTHLLRSFIKFCFHHSKIKSISTRHHVISPLCLSLNIHININIHIHICKYICIHIHSFIIVHNNTVYRYYKT